MRIMKIKMAEIELMQGGDTLALTVGRSATVV